MSATGRSLSMKRLVSLLSRRAPCCAGYGEGLLVGQQSVPGAPWRIVLSDEVRQRLAGGDAPAGWVGLSEAARRLGLGKSHVAYLVKQGKLGAVRTRVGKRYCWRIDVSSATCGRQADLLDQMKGASSKES